MTLYDDIIQDLTNAIKHRDKEKLSVLRGLKAAIKNKQVELRQELNEDQIQGVISSEIKKRKLFYIDSRTTVKTVAYKTAKELGVPAANKSLFIDHDPSIKSIGFQMERLLGMARYKGSAVGIGQPHKETIMILKKYEKKLKADFKVVPISEIVK